MRNVAVLGAGAWGTALAVLLSTKGLNTTLWSRSLSQVQDMSARRENIKYLPGIVLPETLTLTADPAEAVVGADFVLSVIPAQHWRAEGAQFETVLHKNIPILLCMKGIEQGSLLLPHEVTAKILPGRPVALLSGPSFASDVAAGLPTAVTLAAEDAPLAKVLADVVSAPTFRPYHTRDITGVALGGAAKNVLAIACGIVTGAGLGESARAALASRGFAEILRLAQALDARQETLIGLSGLGDLMLTCASPQSRNMAYGLALGEGADPADLLAKTGSVVEGAHTAEALIALAHRHDIEMPLAEAVQDVVSKAITVPDAIKLLLARPLKAE